MDNRLFSHASDLIQTGRRFHSRLRLSPTWNFKSGTWDQRSNPVPSVKSVVVLFWLRRQPR